ncbi:hypothetical protein B0H11DRAFT_1956399 [Mycena galericulata]|nr:hypothetical protein B0H11DRAFT_1956399 [Mycena galericulata]
MAAYYGHQLFFNGTGDPGNFQLMVAPLLFGVLFNVLFFGVFMVQVHSYFRLCKSDSGIKYLIYYLIIMETINTICDVGLIYEPLITLHGSPITKPPLLLAADPIVTTLISTPTQLFMAWRIRLVTTSQWPAAIVAFLAFTSLAGGTATTILSVPVREFASKLPAVETALTVWLTSAAFADLFITTFLVNFLWVNKTGFKTQTDSVTDKIIFFTVQTGAVTSFAAIADVSLFLIVPNTTVNYVWDFSLSKFYAICLISTLNARAEWNTLLVARPSDEEKAKPNAIIRVRRATDVVGLQLYIPSQFESSADPAPRRRTPHAERAPRPLPRAKGRGGGGADPYLERARRTAEWAMTIGR